MIDPDDLALEVTIDFAAPRERSFPSHPCGVHEHDAGIEVWVTSRSRDLADARSGQIRYAGKHALTKVDREKIGEVSKHKRIGIDIDERVQRQNLGKQEPEVCGWREVVNGLPGEKLAHIDREHLDVRGRLLADGLDVWGQVLRVPLVDTPVNRHGRLAARNHTQRGDGGIRREVPVEAVCDSRRLTFLLRAAHWINLSMIQMS